MTFAYPWAFAPAVLVLIAALVRRRTRTVVAYPDGGILAGLPKSLRQRLRLPILYLSALLSLALLSVAAARPQRFETVAQTKESRNLLLALDISRSMAADDMRQGFGMVTRLDAVKRVVAEFVRRREGDRIGLVIFGRDAYVQAPLTLDHSVIQHLVSRLEVGMAGDGTAIGDGLGLSVKRIRDLPGDSKAIILLTDGVSNAGQVNPLKAAEVAKELGIRVYSIGVGVPGGTTVQIMPQSWFDAGARVQADFDEETLRRIARITGGRYFNARDVEGLASIYAEIDRLERTEDETPPEQLPHELFPIFAVAGLAALVLCVLLERSIFLRVP